MEPLIGVVILMPHGTEFLKRSPVLSVYGIGYTVMRLFFVLPVRCPQAGGKDKTMKTPVEFDYDLWTGEDGRRMVRVKHTGEECEVDVDTFRLLRAEEKRLRRSMQGVPVPGGGKEETSAMLSLDIVSVEDGGENLTPGWLEAPDNTENTVMLRLTLRELRGVLTPVQLDIYKMCLLGGVSYKDYANRKGVSYQSVQQAVILIRKKAAKILL